MYKGPTTKRLKDNSQNACFLAIIMLIKVFVCLKPFNAKIHRILSYSYCDNFWRVVFFLLNIVSLVIIICAFRIVSIFCFEFQST